MKKFALIVFPAAAPQVQTPQESRPIATAPPRTPVMHVGIPQADSSHDYESWRIGGHRPFTPTGNVKTLTTGDLNQDLGVAGKFVPVISFQWRDR
jgi:hypothetical protein